MNQGSREASGDGGAIDQKAAAFRAANKLALAASPTFALMALLIGALSGGSSEMLCLGAHPWPLSGMATMYLLMSAFHATPWLKLIASGGVRVRAALLARPTSAR